MSFRKKSHAYFNLAQMSAAGMPVLRAVRTAGAGARGPLGRSLLKCAAEIEKGGVVLADAMRSHPHAFSPMDIMIVEVADNSGNLPEGLRMLANWYDLMGRIRRIVISGMILPIMILNFAAFIFPLPGLVTSGFDFDAYFRSVIITLLSFYGPLIALLIIARLSGTNGSIRKVLDYIGFYIPVLGGALQAMALSRYCMAFGMMARSGVSVITTAETAAKLCGNALMQERLAGGADSARLGNPVVDGFSKHLPLEFVEMWRIGEETGDLGTRSTMLAATYEERMVWRFTALAKAVPWIFYAFVSGMLVMMIFKLLSGYVNIINGAGNLLD